MDLGIDMGDDALLASRSWRWLKTHILGLLDSHTAQVDPAGNVIYPTRLLAALNPTADEKTQRAHR